MKRVTNFILLISFLCNTVNATCDWTAIKKNSDNTYIYSEELHLCVGNLIQENKTKDAQVADLLKAISMKDLALTASDQRAQLWNDTSIKLEDRIQKVDTLTSKNDVLYFGLGVLTTIAVAWATSRVTR